MLAASVAGCAATRQEVVAKLGDQYIGKNVDVLVTRFGPPTSSFRMNSGETSYLWQLNAETSIDIDSNRYGSRGTATTSFCKVSVIASTAGIVKSLTTEDASGTQGLLGLAGVDIYGSICARHLEMRRES
jgi:hypothetical protein